MKREERKKLHAQARTFESIDYLIRAILATTNNLIRRKRKKFPVRFSFGCQPGILIEFIFHFV